MSKTLQNTARSDDLNLIEVMREAWVARIFLGAGLCAGFLLATFLMFLIIPKIEARMVVAPAQVMDVSFQARYQDGQNSYMRNQSGDTDVADGFSNFTRFEAMMRGASVARLLLRDKRIVDGLLADKAFVFSRGYYDFQPADLAQYIKQRVQVDPFGETALKSFIYQHNDPKFAAYFLQQIHRVSDQLIRADLRGQVDQRIGYLERVIGKTMNPEQRRIMTNLLLEQERLRMMVSMDAPVAASVIEPAASGVRAVWPDKYLFYGVFGALGLMVGYLVFGVVHYQVEEIKPDERQDDRRGEELQHKPKRPLKYGSWFQNAPDNANDLPERKPKRRLKSASDAAE